MKQPINIHALRDGSVKTDRAILDLLHLQQLGMAPGIAPVRLLEQLWGITQPQVSRRIAAVAELGLYRVETNNAGRYLLLADQRISRQHWEVVTMPPPVEVDDSDRPSARERWEAVRQQLQEVVA